MGGIAAAVGFIAARLAFERLAPQTIGGEYGTLVSAMSIGWAGYAGIAGIVAILAILTSLTSRYTVYRYLKGLE